jgi:hypothetical protein
MSIQSILRWIGFISIIIGIFSSFGALDSLEVDEFAYTKLSLALGGGVLGGLLLMGFSKIIYLLQELVDSQDDKLQEVIKQLDKRNAS